MHEVRAAGSVGNEATWKCQPPWAYSWTPFQQVFSSFQKRRKIRQPNPAALLSTQKTVHYVSGTCYDWWCNLFFVSEFFANSVRISKKSTNSAAKLSIWTERFFFIKVTDDFEEKTFIFFKCWPLYRTIVLRVVVVLCHLIVPHFCTSHHVLRILSVRLCRFNTWFVVDFSEVGFDIISDVVFLFSWNPHCFTQRPKIWKSW